MTKKISELPITETVVPGDYIEVAINDPESPTGFSSRRVDVSVLGSTMTHRFPISGSATLDEGEFVLCTFTLLEIAQAALGGVEDFSGAFGSATFNVSVSVKSRGAEIASYGSAIANIVYCEDATTYMTYLSNAEVYSTLPVALPYSPPLVTSGTLPLVITSVVQDTFSSELTFNAIIALDAFYSTLPDEIAWSGFIDMTLTPAVLEMPE